MLFPVACLLADQASAADRVQAVECSLVGRNQANAPASARNVKTNEVIALPAPSYGNCEQVEVTSGQVAACVSDARGRGRCRTYRKDEQLSAESLSSRATSPSSWQTMVDWLKGSADRVPGVSRGAGDEQPVLPTGPVVLVGTKLEVDFSRPSLRGAESIDVHEWGPNGQVVARLSPASGQSSLSTARLQSGKTYWWIVQSPRSALPPNGRFTLQPEEVRRAAREEAKRIQRVAPNDPPAQALMMAEWLQQRECEHEARELLVAQGFELK
jgi:hypothetical protein